MSSLAKHLYSKAKGRIQTDQKEVTATSGTPDEIAVPPSGKKLCIQRIAVLPTTAGSDAALTIEKFDGTTQTALFTSLTCAVQNPTDMDLSSCPIILEADEKLRGYVATSGTVNVSVSSFILDD